jgi:hypothetical protein
VSERRRVQSFNANSALSAFCFLRETYVESKRSNETKKKKRKKCERERAVKIVTFVRVLGV